MRKARIENGVVREILEADPFPDFHHDLLWVECGVDVREGWQLINGQFLPPLIAQPSTEAMLAAYERDLDDFIDAKAQELTFKDRHSLALRAAYQNEWQALGAAFGTWMDTCNAIAWEGRQEILADTRPMPANKEAFLAELPEFEPPV